MAELSPAIGGRNLKSVTFHATSVHDGHELTGTPCTQGTAVSPVHPYVFAVTNTGTFETSQSCNNTGPSLVLPYD
jgi:hypothetical protein